MPTFYEGGCIATISDQKTDKQSFAQGFVYRERIGGKLKNCNMYCLFFMIAAALFMVFAYREFTMYKMVIKAAISAVLVICAVYFAVIKPNYVKKYALGLYAKSDIMRSPVTIKLYRDSFFINNEYEKLNGYWTDIIAGKEDDEKIVLVSEWTVRPIVILKKDVDKEEILKISQHLKNTLTYKYKS